MFRFYTLVQCIKFSIGLIMYFELNNNIGDISNLPASFFSVVLEFDGLIYFPVLLIQNLCYEELNHCLDVSPDFNPRDFSMGLNE